MTAACKDDRLHHLFLSMGKHDNDIANVDDVKWLCSNVDNIKLGPTD